MINGLKRYKMFPLIDSSSALMNTVSWQLPAFLLAAFFSPVVVGFYALGMRTLQLPMSLVGSAIAQVFFQRAAEAHKSGNFATLVQGITELLLKIIVFPVMLLTVVGPELFSFVFGEVWIEAGNYIQILSLWIIFWFLYSPLSVIYVVLEKQKLGLWFNMVNLSTRFLSLLIGGMVGGVYLCTCSLFSLRCGRLRYVLFGIHQDGRGNREGCHPQFCPHFCLFGAGLMCAYFYQAHSGEPFKRIRNLLRAHCPVLCSNIHERPSGSWSIVTSSCMKTI